MGYQMSDTLGFDVGFAHLFFDDTDMDNTEESTGHTLVGEYEADANIFSAQVNMLF